MVFSRPTEYAIRAMTFLARQPLGKLTAARSISEAESIPVPFLWKILNTLKQYRLIRSFKGVHGGYELARPAGEITVLAIVAAMDNLEGLNACVLGLPECNESHPCSMHGAWKEIRAQTLVLLEQSTLADLFTPTERPKARAR